LLISSYNFFQLIAKTGNKQERENAPYIAAKFPQRNIPYTFYLGSGETNEGFTNRKLERGKKYRIFVRAVVDTPQKVHTPSTAQYITA
jgi:netrin-G3 ligand